MNLETLRKAREELIQAGVYSYQQMVENTITQTWDSDEELRKNANWWKRKLLAKLYDAKQELTFMSGEPCAEKIRDAIMELEYQVDKVDAVIEYGIAPHIQDWRNVFQMDISTAKQICRKYGITCGL